MEERGESKRSFKSFPSESFFFQVLSFISLKFNLWGLSRKAKFSSHLTTANLRTSCCLHETFIVVEVERQAGGRQAADRQIKEESEPQLRE